MTTLATVIGRGVTGSRPAAASAGRLYFDTTVSIMYRDNGSSWDSAEGAGFANPMTTAGDTIIGGASGLPTRLAAGATSGHVLTSNGSGAAPSWQAAAGGGGSGAVLGAKSYSTGSDAVWATIASTTVADIDATNASLAITIPASGAIVAQCLVDCSFTGGQDGAYLWLRSGSTNHQSSAVIVGNVAAGGVNGIVTGGGRIQASWYVTGLTPGALTIKVGFSAIGASTFRVHANDGTGASGHKASPFFMMALAA